MRFHKVTLQMLGFLTVVAAICSQSLYAQSGGKIAVVDNFSNIRLMNSDGSGLQLLRAKPADGFIYIPKIDYDENSGVLYFFDTPVNRISSIHLDGTGERAVATLGTDRTLPAYAATDLVVESSSNSVWVMHGLRNKIYQYDVITGRALTLGQVIVIPKNNVT